MSGKGRDNWTNSLLPPFSRWWMKNNFPSSAQCTRIILQEVLESVSWSVKGFSPLCEPKSPYLKGTLMACLHLPCKCQISGRQRPFKRLGLLSLRRCPDEVCYYILFVSSLKPFSPYFFWLNCISRFIGGLLNSYADKSSSKTPA